MATQLNRLADNLLALLRAGQLAQAEAVARTLTQREPRNAFGWKVFGSLLARDTDRLEESVEALEQARRLAPQDAETLNSLAQARQGLGHLDEAIELYRHTLILQPERPEFWNNQGLVQQELKRLDEALESYDEALRRQPDFIKAHNNRGSVLRELGRMPEALASHERALALDPNHADSAFQRGLVLHELGRFNDALNAYSQALALAPLSVLALTNRGNILRVLGRYDEARTSLDLALAIQPASCETLNNLGILLYELGQLDNALEVLDAALYIRPDDAEALTNRGNVLKDQGRLDEALFCYRRALDRQPELLFPMQNRLFCLNYQAGIPHRRVFDEHCSFERDQAARIARLPAVRPVAKDSERRLRIGLVSGDFRFHSVAFFMLPILEQLDRQEFQVFCYSTDPRRDEVTQAFQRLADGWIDAAGLRPIALAERIRQDGIDLLFDLSGHTEGNALLAFAAKPAPVQLTWIGYPNTTGLTSMDYRLVDAVTDPPGEADTWHSERLIRLPMGFLCYRPWDLGVVLAVGPPPCLESGRITFGSFNNLAKVTPTTLELWSDVLQRMPDARLLLKSHTAADLKSWNSTAAYFVTRGIAPERVERLPRAPSYQAHLLQYRRIDVALDTYPYHGTTTTCEALYMGVPVVTLAGDRHVSRVGVSLLTRVGLTELIAHSGENYVEIAADLAHDQERLSGLRGGLRERLERSPLRDEIGFTRTLEGALRQMWRIWCAGESPRVFEVRPGTASHGRL
ncbi:tetratricopeptide repeat protein [Thiocystis violacea]|uniref:tetratricopeptide repeat protein n=1 Tax=Thiocystis violacea TaxID=13725 RepID=UPI00190551C4|nr:glycosyltransferase family 41 protein [Thiocystis violacea]MBK1720387.1 hypothetical protein [Thiocystis violacea]